MRHFFTLFLALLLVGMSYAAETQKVRLTYQGFPYKRTTCEYPSYVPGDTVILAKGSPRNENGEVIVAWSYNGENYKAGSEFVMPDEDVVLVPVWADDQGIAIVQKSEVSVQKVLRDGQLIIIRDGREYNVLGGRLK